MIRFRRNWNKVQTKTRSNKRCPNENIFIQSPAVIVPKLVILSEVFASNKTTFILTHSQLIPIRLIPRKEDGIKDKFHHIFECFRVSTNASPRHLLEMHMVIEY